jgi:hypothetical protein
VLLAACAPVASPPIAVPPIVAVVPPAPPPPDDPALKERADAAERDTAERLRTTAQSCASDWLEPEDVCKPASFVQAATTFQAYYVDHANARVDDARIDSFDRLGGPTSEPQRMSEDAARFCDDRCRAARLETISTEIDAAIVQCEKAKSGFAACKAVEKKLAVHVRATEVERWSWKCEDHCQGTRDRRKYEAEIDARRPRTAAARAACERACEAKHAGGWCGTGLLACLSECAPPSRP